MNSEATIYVEPFVAMNTRTLTYCRSGISAVTGSAAGILGLTGYTGFVFYLVTAFISSGIIWALMTDFKPELYFKKSRDVWIEGVFGGLFSYVLFWTLMYGIVHVYE
ncbi:ER membrane protein complex subunit 6 [Basidiobolus meristosporus CBS 931.73]|uniref:ER membrane protein complex subunit 6 n=1 Tax=Basidiobolus meristosporus CBS 931.73 TaxID=1314790 RepID=A0A1Y1Y1N8_9FUNG|nr:ER membrane protein complex subunit 6 [Basidiobolus meristosporus CBS 931.73]|eukprot:ORX91544.1 ER membrane protein complex subunit 6 [Basidiobolus meristosporus CBS 931.73]